MRRNSTKPNKSVKTANDKPSPWFDGIWLTPKLYKLLHGGSIDCTDLVLISCLSPIHGTKPADLMMVCGCSKYEIKERIQWLGSMNLVRVIKHATKGYITSVHATINRGV